MQKPNETQEVKQPAQGNVDFSEGITDGASNFEELLKNAPYVNTKENKQPDAKPENNKDDDEYVVRPKAEPQEPEEKEEEQSNETPEVKRRKIGEFELTDDEWIEAYHDRENRSKWQKNLTQKSQIASKILPNLREEDLPYLLPFAMGQKALPDNLKQALLDGADLPKEMTVKTYDEDGNNIEVIVKTEDMPDEFFQKLTKKALSESYPEINELRETNVKLKTDLETIKKQYDTYNQRLFERTVIDYMNEHPDVAISVRKNESVRDNLKMIMESGDDHPEYENAQKFILVSQFAQNSGLTLEEAHRKLFGSTEMRKKATEKVKENQQNDMPRERGKEPEKTWIASEIEQMSDTTNRAMNQFGI